MVKATKRAETETDEPFCSSQTMQDFFLKYADALARRDMDAVMSFLAIPIIVRRADGTSFMRDRAELIEVHEQLFAQYKERGVTGIEFAYQRGRVMSGRRAAGAVAWTLIHVDGSRTPMAEVAYTLQCEDGVWQIEAVDFAQRDARQSELGW